MILFINDGTRRITLLFVLYKKYYFKKNIFFNSGKINQQTFHESYFMFHFEILHKLSIHIFHYFLFSFPISFHIFIFHFRVLMRRCRFILFRVHAYIYIYKYIYYKLMSFFFLFDRLNV